MLGKAIDYTLTPWDRLDVYLNHVHLEIDSNWLENGVRPTAVGKMAGLFMGGETTGQRAAIIYTMVECAKRHGHNPEAYLADVLRRLPAMTNQDDLSALLPSRWKPPTATGPVVDVEATVCLSCSAPTHKYHTHLCMLSMQPRPAASDAHSLSAYGPPGRAVLARG